MLPQRLAAASVPAGVWPALLAGLVALVVGWSTIDGVFTVDEGHYQTSLAALRSGGFHVPGTEGLPASRELAALNPSLRELRVDATPVYPHAPPLWAFVAWPFSHFGLSGLFWLNVLSFACTLWLVDRWMARLEASSAQRAAAMLVLGLGGYMLEYAMGAWPHALSVALVFGAFACAGSWRRARTVWALPLAGGLAGVASGVRYPNIVPAVAIALGLLVLPMDAPATTKGASRLRSRLRALLAYAAGLSLPLAASAWINHLRSGVANPVSKASGYLTVGAAVHASGEHRGMSTLRAFWMRIVDYRVHPELPEWMKLGHPYLRRDPDSGAILIGKILKKSLLQSVPWAALGLLLLLLVWRRTPRSARAQELRAASLVVYAVVATFALAGPLRTDGLCFNQRYLLELLPLLAAASVLALPQPSRHELAFAALSSLPFAYAAWSMGVGGATTAWWLSVAPLGLALLVVLAAAGAHVSPRRHAFALAAWGVFGAAVGWGGGVHFGSDLRASRAMRAVNADRLELVAEVIAPGSALYAYWGNKDAFGPLTFTHQVLVLDPWVDQGESAPEITRALIARGQPVYVYTRGMPPAVFAKLVDGRAYEEILDGWDGFPQLVRLRPSP